MRRTLQIPAVGDADDGVYEGVTYEELRDLENRIIDLQGKLRRKDKNNALLKMVTVDRVGIHFNPSEEYLSRFRGKKLTKLTEILFAYVEDVKKAYADATA